MLHLDILTYGMRFLKKKKGSLCYLMTRRTSSRPYTKIHVYKLLLKFIRPVVLKKIIQK